MSFQTEHFPIWLKLVSFLWTRIPYLIWKCFFSIYLHATFGLQMVKMYIHLLLLLADHNFMRRNSLYFCRPDITLVIRWYFLPANRVAILRTIAQLFNGEMLYVYMYPLTSSLTEWLFVIIIQGFCINRSNSTDMSMTLVAGN